MDRNLEQRVSDVQAKVRAHAPDAVGVVDELLAERRAEDALERANSLTETAGVFMAREGWKKSEEYTAWLADFDQFLGTLLDQPDAGLTRAFMRLLIGRKLPVHAVRCPNFLRFTKVEGPKIHDMSDAEMLDDCERCFPGDPAFDGLRRAVASQPRKVA